LFISDAGTTKAGNYDGVVAGVGSPATSTEHFARAVAV
jgi:hypothetical protein